MNKITDPLITNLHKAANALMAKANSQSQNESYLKTVLSIKNVQIEQLEKENKILQERNEVIHNTAELDGARLVFVPLHLYVRCRYTNIKHSAEDLGVSSSHMGKMLKNEVHMINPMNKDIYHKKSFGRKKV